MAQTIAGVVVTALTTHADDRGYFRELTRLAGSPLSACAQISVTMSYPGVIKAWHYHERQDDLWYCASGMLQAVLYDRRPRSKTKGMTQVVVMGDYAPRTLFIPHGVVHGYKVLGDRPAIVFYATTHEYDPKDERRLKYDDPTIGFEWSVAPR